MAMDFNEASNLFKEDKIPELASTADGLRFLKLKTLSRKEHLIELLDAAHINCESESAIGLLRQAVAANIPDELVDATIAAIFQRESGARLQNEPTLVNELYKMEVFDWGGLHQNSLEKTIVDNYVKKITSFDLLENKIENEIQQSMRGFVLCQWYNHWTSIIIEDIFNTHDRVTPSVGQVKKIDFFIDTVPFDLKVTYLPEGFIKEMRRDAELRPELTLVRALAKELDILFDDDLADGKLLEDLLKKISDHPDQRAQELCESLRHFRLELLGQSIANPNSLIRWLYENKGIRRFDASNRLFLILVDSSSFFESWKLKRAKPLLLNRIRQFLDELPETPGIEIEFQWEGDNFTCRAAACFVVHPHL